MSSTAFDDQFAPEPVEVTQADKDRAEAFWQEYGPFRMGTVSALSAAFARHRIAHSEGTSDAA